MMLTKAWWCSVVVASSAVVGMVGMRATAVLQGRAPQTPLSSPQRLVEMRHHFAQVLLVHDAIVRGDLQALSEPARDLAIMSVPATLPAAAATRLASIREAAQRAAEASTLTAAARATASMVGECANCHRTVGVTPRLSEWARPSDTAPIGPMADHARAADGMLLGLLDPSTSRWREGAERLAVAMLGPGPLPQDPALADEIRRAEERLRQAAHQAAKADSRTARAAGYVQVLTTCAHCHDLYRRAV